MQDRSVQTSERQEKLKDLILRLHAGEDEEVIKEAFAKDFQTVSPLEISVMERKLMKDEGLSAEEIMQLCNVHVSVMVDYVEDPDNIPDDFEKPGHPVHVLKEENLALEAALMRVRNLLEVYLEEPDAELEKGLNHQLDILWDFDKHYTRKENSFFPIMEKYGNTAPPQVMWGVDDEIRDLFKAFRAAFQAGKMEEMMPIFSEFEYEMQEMIVKEENILIPMVTDAFTDEDWIKIADEMDQIGYCIVKPMVKWEPKAKAKKEEKESEIKTDRIPLGAGSLSHKELDLILNSLSLEITFVDKDDIVQYYNNHSGERISLRNPLAIGRELMYCHPPRVYDTVKQLVDDLRAGKKDQQVSWFRQKDGRLIHTTHKAIRDEAGEFLGILEYKQDITEIVEIEGENRDVNA